VLSRESKKASSAWRSLIRHSTARSYLPWYFSTKTSIAVSASPGVGPDRCSADRSSWGPARIWRPCRVRCSLYGTSIVGAACRERPRPVPSRSRGRRRRWRVAGNPEPALPQVDQEFAPALRALAHADLEADQLLLAFRRGTNQHQHAFAVIFHAGLQVHAIGPDVDIATRRQIASLPAFRRARTAPLMAALKARLTTMVGYCPESFALLIRR